MNPTTLTTQICSLEASNQALITENKALNRTRMILEHDNAQLRAALNRALSDVNIHRDNATQLKVILDQVGHAILHGMSQIQVHRCAEQEQKLLTDGVAEAAE